MRSRHHPNGDAINHCDNARIESLIADYQTTRDVGTLASIVDLTQRRAETLIRFYKTTRYRPIDEPLSDVNFKLLRAVDKFDPAKGSAFTFVSQVIANTLFTSVTSRRKDLARHRRLTKVDLNSLITNGEVESQHVVEDIAHRIRSGVKTTLRDERELAATRWFVDSFCDASFEHRRHECADACMCVFSLSYDRSRELYDLTMLEVRRVLYNDLPQRGQVVPGRLLGTRLAWLARYAPLMNDDEFSKFVSLMRCLSPFVLFLIDPQNNSRRPDRCPAISRTNIEYILDGHPAARPLFQ